MSRKEIFNSYLGYATTHNGCGQGRVLSLADEIAPNGRLRKDVRRCWHGPVANQEPSIGCLFQPGSPSVLQASLSIGVRSCIFLLFEEYDYHGSNSPS